MNGYLVELFKSKVASLDDVLYVELCRGDDGDHFRLNGPTAIARAMTGLYLNLKREDWSDRKALDVLVKLLQQHGLQVKTPHGNDITELLICHDTLAAGNFDAFSKLPGNVHTKDKLSIINYYPPLKFNDDGNLKSYPNACTDGVYRYFKKNAATSNGQRYTCCRRCTASVVMDKRGRITKMWEKRSQTNPHSEECKNPPTVSDSKKGKKRGTYRKQNDC